MSSDQMFFASSLPCFLGGTCLKYAAGAVGVLPVGGSLATSACNAAAEYVDKLSDAEGKQALEGMDRGKKQELVG